MSVSPKNSLETRLLSIETEVSKLSAELRRLGQGRPASSDGEGRAWPLSVRDDDPEELSQSAAKVLQVVLDAKAPVGLSDVMRTFKLTRNYASKILRRLMRRGLISRLPGRVYVAKQFTGASGRTLPPSPAVKALKAQIAKDRAALASSAVAKKPATKRQVHTWGKTDEKWATGVADKVLAVVRAQGDLVTTSEIAEICKRSRPWVCTGMVRLVKAGKVRRVSHGMLIRYTVKKAS